MTSEKLLMVLHAGAAAAAAARMLQRGLAKRQTAIFCFLLLTAVSNAVVATIPFESKTYFYSYLFIQPLTVFVEACVVRELFSLTMTSWPGIRAAALRMMYWTISASIAVSLLLTALFWGGGANGRSNLFYILLIERASQFGLAAVVISLLLFLSHFPLQLPRNITVSSYFFGSVFLVEAADRLIATISPHLFSAQAEMGTLIVLCVLFTGWAAMLRKHEAVPAQIRFEYPADRELLIQLEHLNRTLSGVGRR